MTIQPYLFFEGRCDEAISFYRKAVDAEIAMLMRYKDAPQGNACPGATPDKVMHATLRIGDATVMASDGNCSGKPNFEGFGLSLGAATDADANRLFGNLTEGGTVVTPLQKTFFASSFGMVRDRFGILWMVMAGPQ
jgi:PhnB protein